MLEGVGGGASAVQCAEFVRVDCGGDSEKLRVSGSGRAGVLRRIFEVNAKLWSARRQFFGSAGAALRFRDGGEAGAIFEWLQP
jgi:hypothetical protein